jgi:hypothetical protein
VTKAQAKARRGSASERRNLPVDVLYLAEAVEDLRKEQRSACRSEVRSIIDHLLKLQLSPPGTPRRLGSAASGWPEPRSTTA